MRARDWREPLSGPRATAFAALALLSSGCNMVLGLEDHDAFPESCGAESLTTARFSFSDDDTGHCYSLVQTDNPEDGTSFDDAKSSCGLAGGTLACVNDEAELQLIARSVPTRAWLGMNAQTNASLSFSCISGERFDPDYPAWVAGHPTMDGGGNCTFITDGLVQSSWCGAGLQNWLCELEPSTAGD